MAPRSPSSSLLVTALPLSRRSSKLPWRTEAVALLARLPRGLPPLVDCSDCSRKILLLRLELLLADVAPRVALPEDVERWVGRARPPALSHQPPNRQHDADNHGAPKDERHQHHPDAPHSPHSPHRVHAPPPFVWAVLRCGHGGPQPCNEPHERALALSHVLLLLLGSPRCGSGPGPPRCHLGLLQEHCPKGLSPRRQSSRLAMADAEVPADAETSEPDGGQAATGHLATNRMH